MKMSSTKVMAGVAVAIIGGLFLLTGSHPKDHGLTSNGQSASDRASGDTNNEVMHELTAQLQQVKKQNDAYLKKNKQLEKMLSSQTDSSISATKSKLLAKFKVAEDKTNAQINALEKKINALNNSNSVQLGYHVNGSDEAPAREITTVSDVSNSESTDDTDTQVARHGDSRTSDDDLSTFSQQGLKKPKAIPRYTIPALSNLGDTSLLTSIIAEVPNNGTFEQPPFPFEAMIGRKNLMAANGVSLPNDLSGMKIYGYSVGVGSFLDGLSCARAYITKVLFVFNDGHFVSYGKNYRADSVNPDDTLGYITDAWGNTCMPGKYVTNAPRVLTTLTGMGTVAGAGQYMGLAQTSSLLNTAGGATTVVKGNPAQYAIGNGLAYGLNKTMDWMLDRLKGSFDVVLIPSSKHGKPVKVVATFTKTIPIDETINGRKIRYDVDGAFSANISSLD